MAETLGAAVHLEHAPLKYDGLTYTEIWISEAQERMVLAVPHENLSALRAICDEEHVELAVLGTFGAADSAGTPELVLNYRGAEVGRLSMAFLHEGLPTPTREAVWSAPRVQTDQIRTEQGVWSAPSLRAALLALLAHPTIASKHEIIRQYDHEVQGNTVLKPLVGPGGRGPGDAAVIEPVPGSGRGLAIACGLATPIGDPALGGDPYRMALAAIDECVRNLVCVGADPDRIAILDNFCWPSCAEPRNLAGLVRAAEGCYDGAKAYRTPFISGKDSLNNQFTTRDGRLIEIPPTLLITGVGIVHNLASAITSDAKRAGRAIALLSGADHASSQGLRGSAYHARFGTLDPSSDRFPSVDLRTGPSAARWIHRLIADGRVHAAHDVSDGGLLVALAEMLIGAETLGAEISVEPGFSSLFAEPPSTYVLEIDPVEPGADHAVMIGHAAAAGLHLRILGRLTDTRVLRVHAGSNAPSEWTVDELARAWLGTVTV
jgi:phosphoribosylformylglycinamidine synthase